MSDKTREALVGALVCAVNGADWSARAEAGRKAADAIDARIRALVAEELSRPGPTVANVPRPDPLTITAEQCEQLLANVPASGREETSGSASEQPRSTPTASAGAVSASSGGDAPKTAAPISSGRSGADNLVTVRCMACNKTMLRRVGEAFPICECTLAALPSSAACATCGHAKELHDDDYADGECLYFDTGKKPCPCGKFVPSSADAESEYTASLRRQRDDYRGSADHRALVIGDLTHKLEAERKAREAAEATLADVRKRAECWEHELSHDLGLMTSKHRQSTEALEAERAAHAETLAKLEAETRRAEYLWGLGKMYREQLESEQRAHDETKAASRDEQGELWVDECERARKERDDVSAHLAAAKTRGAALKAEWESIRDELASAKRELAAVTTGVDGVWRWQGDGGDHPESLSCPVVMSAERARGFARAHERWQSSQQALAAREREVERLVGVLRSVRAWDMLNPPTLISDGPWLVRLVDAALASVSAPSQPKPEKFSEMRQQVTLPATRDEEGRFTVAEKPEEITPELASVLYPAEEKPEAGGKCGRCGGTRVTTRPDPYTRGAEQVCACPDCTTQPSEAERKPVTCAWAPEDEYGIMTDAKCGKPAKWLACTPVLNMPTCDEHRCRCRKPLPAEKPGEAGETEKT